MPNLKWVRPELDSSFRRKSYFPVICEMDVTKGFQPSASAQFQDVHMKMSKYSS
jgi:hypothetical protein